MPICFALVIKSHTEGITAEPRSIHDGNHGCLVLGRTPPTDLFIPYTIRPLLSTAPFLVPFTPPLAVLRPCNTPPLKPSTYCISCTSNCAAGRRRSTPREQPAILSFYRRTRLPASTPPTLLLPEPRPISSHIRCNSHPQKSTADCCCLRLRLLLARHSSNCLTGSLLFPLSYQTPSAGI